MTDTTMLNNKKSSGRTDRDEDGIDKIPAEIGEGPSVSKPIEPCAEEEKGDPKPELSVQSAAAKKKKKKKEKEKEKRAAAGEKPCNEIKAKGEVVKKKVPKDVREMQEAIARRREAEERRKREEEERQRKEEEELRRQEELERQAEEARLRKKEREKEKKLKKKQEGKLLTRAQREKARRRAAMKEQILARSNLPSGSETASGPTKRPSYQTKKSKQTKHQETLSEAASVEPVRVGEAEPVSTDNKSYIADDVEDEWDAKSWDDVNISVSSFFTEEEEAYSELRVVKMETNSPASSKSTGFLEKAEVKPQEVETAPESEASCSARTPNSSGGNLRSPICCIMGHVDAGKTKLLDCIRGTNVQEGEAGGITQQIGATYFPMENIRERTKELKPDATLKVPGLLVIDTPGHDSFRNLRSRGAGLCDIAVLVVDIMSGLEPQTIESLNLLKRRKTPFIVALNKVDRVYGWKTCHNVPMDKTMKRQTKDVQVQFETRLIQIITQFKEQGLNTDLYYSRNKGKHETFSIVPTSAISGEGIPELLLLLVQSTQRTLVEKLTFSNEVQCTVLEVKVVEGHGTTIDVVLVNGVLHEGDQIVVCGLQGPIVTTIRALLTPHPMKELRVKGSYLHHKEIKAAQGIKISAQGLEHAFAGTSLYVLGPEDDLEHIKEVADEMRSVRSRIDKSGEGVRIHASTLGSLEALLEFSKSPEVSIPVSGISIGTVHKKDVNNASSMLKKKKEYAAILAFDVKVTPEAQELADKLGVQVFRADIIYRLFDQFKAYIDNVKEEKKREAADETVFPCVLKIVPGELINKKDPIMLGVEVVEGRAKVGTPLCIQRREDFIDIGCIKSIKDNEKLVDVAQKGQIVSIMIVGTNLEEKQKKFGRHLNYKDVLLSHLSRKSIDILNEYYLDDLSKEEKQLARMLKKLFRIQWH